MGPIAYIFEGGEGSFQVPGLLEPQSGTDFDTNTDLGAWTPLCHDIQP